MNNCNNSLPGTMNFSVGLKHLIYSGYIFVDSVIADFRLKKWANKKLSHDGPIRVGFIVQMPEVWDKEAPIYEAMRDSEDFDAKLIVIPNRSLITNEFNDPEKSSYFFNKYPEAINGNKNKTWLDLKSLKLDYVFIRDVMRITCRNNIIQKK